MSIRRLSASMAAARLPLSYKILGVTVMLLCMMSLLFLIIFIKVYEKRLIDDYTRASFHISSLLETSLENAMLKRDIPGLQQIVRKLGEQSAIDGVFIVDPGFEVRFSSHIESVGRGFPDADAVFAPNQINESAQFIEAETQQAGSVLRSVNPVLNKPACTACHGAVDEHPVNGYLVIDYASGTIHQNAREAAYTLALAGGLVVLLTILAIAWALRQLVLNPLRKMDAACKALAQGDFNVQCEVRGGDEIGSLGATMDSMVGQISEQRDRLQKHRGFIQAVIDAVPDGIRVIGPDYRIHMVNKAYCRQQKTTAEEAVGKKCFASSHGLNEACAASMVTCPHFEFSNTSVKQLKCRHRHISANGRELFTEVHAGRLLSGPDGDAGEYFVESIRDLASQVMLSKEHRLSEVGHLATGVAHEIHNPLSSINLAIRSINCDIEHAETRNKIAPYLQIVTDEIERCMEITQRLLMLSQPDSNLRVLLDLTEVVHEVLDLLSFQAAESGIKVTVRADSRARVVAISSDMHMLVLNTVLNAFHAMSEGGTLTVEVKQLGDKVELSVEDSGCGIEPENAAKVFWPFWSKRADQSMGTGLGLPICRSIVEKHDGTIELNSTPGSGTTLLVKLPAADRLVSSEQKQLATIS